MVSEPPSSMVHEGNVMAEELVVRSLPNKKNQLKVPKKIHKSEREKLKRDQLNELFVALGYALEPARQNNGKASILGDATRLVRDLILQVESLRKENVALVTESGYVTMEKNELKDENTALGADIARLQDELRERLQSDPVWHDRSTTTPFPTLPQATSTPLPTAQPSVASIYVVPLQQDLQAFREPSADPSPPKPPTQVMRPHARYPTPSDSWPLQVLSRNQHSGSSSSNSGEEGSDNA
ncbi:transcription factor bHLH47-like [Iris pallida]|uniref:Transcription factor bHLH47-like n=1 Tax=Iris pallida TaxID=29817 RepID=A0AAX6DJ66_IRIPA|nr:transcription factor bHLH47-like [Iris pallida]KAJ6791833.1 transcription factor bHLH47-like [Iris pallida]